MAGSYHHCVDEKTGGFNFDLIENMGDAWEACHEMFWMIRHLTGNNAQRIDQVVEEYRKRERREVPWEKWGLDVSEGR